MADHLQQQVLDAIQAVLVAGDGTDAGDRVYVDRVDPLPKLPAIVIQEADEGESAEPYTIRGLEQRTLSVEVHCVIKHCGNTAAADARAFGLAVEKLMKPAASLKALCKLGFRISSSRQVNSGAGEELVAARVQTWQFTYLVNPTAPDVVA